MNHSSFHQKVPFKSFPKMYKSQFRKKLRYQVLLVRQRNINVKVKKRCRGVNSLSIFSVKGIYIILEAINSFLVFILP